MLKDNEVKYKGGVTITEEDRQFVTTIDSDKFTIQIPTQFEKTVITNAVSRLIGGVNIESIELREYERIKMVATLCKVVKFAPDWWTSADECPDEDLLWKLWRFYLEANDSFALRLKTKSNTK